MWTRDAAPVLGWEGIGTLAPGHHADMIIKVSELYNVVDAEKQPRHSTSRSVRSDNAQLVKGSRPRASIRRP